MRRKHSLLLDAGLGVILSAVSLIASATIPYVSSPVAALQLATTSTLTCIQTDVNGDGTVNAQDLQLISNHWRTSKNDPNWVATYALFDGMRITIAELEAASGHFNETCSPAWLSYVNLYRATAQLPLVTENPTWSDGDWKHARYMVKNDFIGHSEDSNNPWYTPEGNTAAASGNVMVSSNVNATDAYAIDLWMRGPFHAIGMIDPALLQTGFGSYREAVGTWRMGATLDVIRGRGSVPQPVVFPIKYPSGVVPVPIRSFNGSEFPDPLTSCPGYTAPTGIPILLQLDPNTSIPNLGAHTFNQQGGAPLDHCEFDWTNYTNPDINSQTLGRNVLGARKAIVLMPRSPLTAGAIYNVSITANGQTYAWSFIVANTASALSGIEKEPETLIR